VTSRCYTRVISERLLEVQHDKALYKFYFYFMPYGHFHTAVSLEKLLQ